MEHWVFFGVCVCVCNWWYHEKNPHFKKGDRSFISVPHILHFSSTGWRTSLDLVDDHHLHHLARLVILSPVEHACDSAS